MDNENVKNEAMKKFMLLMIMASGADIVAPEELHVLHHLHLDHDSDFKNINAGFAHVKNERKAVAIIKGLMACHLTPSQMLEIRDFTHELTTAILEFAKDNPDCRESVDPDKIAGKLEF